MYKKWVSILGAFLLSRLLCSAFVYLGHIQRPYLQDVPGGWIGVDHWWLNPWTTYDSFWYLKIASSGYSPEATAFFPLYPFLLSVCNDPVLMAAAGVAISHLALLAALFIVFAVTAHEFDEKLAHITVWVLCFSPAAPFFGAVYTESLFILLLAGTFWAVRSKRWGLCAALALATALVRNPGFLLAAALFIELRQNGGSPLKKHLFVPLAPFVAFCMVQAGFWWTFGSPFSGLVSQSHFHRTLSWPWQPLFKDIQSLLSPGFTLNYYIITTTSLLFTLVALLAWAYRCKAFPFRPGYIILITGITLMNLVYAREIVPTTVSEVRYMGALYPFSQIIAAAIYKLHRYPLAAPFLVSCQLFLFLVFSFYFGMKFIF